MENGQPVTGTEGEGGAALPEPAAGTGGKKKRRIHRPALIARFPKLFWHPSLDAKWANDWPVVPPEQPGEYPELAADLAVWREQLEPRFRRLDHQAQILQNQFWRQHVALIVGGLVATSLGTIQAAAGGGVVLIAVAEALLTGALAGTALGWAHWWSAVAAILSAASTTLAAYISLYAFEQQSKIYGDAARAVRGATRPALAPGTSQDGPPPEDDAAELVRRVEAVFRQEQAQWGQLTSQIQITDQAGG
jgi:hypothetical protein